MSVHPDCTELQQCLLSSHDADDGDVFECQLRTLRCVAPYFSDLRARIETAEAERDEAYERAAEAVEALLSFEANTGERALFSRFDVDFYCKGALRLAATDIRSLKAPS